MKKPSALDRMRHRRDQRESEVLAPVECELRQATIKVRALQDAVRGMEAFVGEKIAGYMLESISEMIRRELTKLIYETVAKARGGTTGPVQITMPSSVFAFADPRSMERMILDRYAQECLPRLSLRVDRAPYDRTRIVDIRIPELGCRQMMADAA